MNTNETYLIFKKSRMIVPMLFVLLGVLQATLAYANYEAGRGYIYHTMAYIINITFLISIIISYFLLSYFLNKKQVPLSEKRRVAKYNFYLFFTTILGGYLVSLAVFLYFRNTYKNIFESNELREFNTVGLFMSQMVVVLMGILLLVYLYQYIAGKPKKEYDGATTIKRGYQNRVVVAAIVIIILVLSIILNNSNVILWVWGILIVLMILEEYSKYYYNGDLFLHEDVIFKRVLFFRYPVYLFKYQNITLSGDRKIIGDNHKLGFPITMISDQCEYSVRDIYNKIVEMSDKKYFQESKEKESE